MPAWQQPTSQHWGRLWDPQMFDLVLRAAVRPLVPNQHPGQVFEPCTGPQASLHSRTRSGHKLEKKLLPHSDSASIVYEPKNSSTRLLVAALWLQLR